MSRSKGIRAGSQACVSTVMLDLNATERDWFDQMRAAIRCTSDANMLRIALWKMARHLDLDCGADVFAIRTSHHANGDNPEEAKRLRQLQRRITA